MTAAPGPSDESIASCACAYDATISPPKKVLETTHQTLELRGRDPLAPGLDDVLGAVADGQRPRGRNRRDVAGLEPAVGVAGVLGRAVVAADRRGPADLELALARPVARERGAPVVDDPQLDAEELEARGDGRVRVRPSDAVVAVRAHDADGRELRHAPGAYDVAAPGLVALRERRRRRRAADDDAAVRGEERRVAPRLEPVSERHEDLGRKRVRHSQFQRLLARPISTRFR